MCKTSICTSCCQTFVQADHFQASFQLLDLSCQDKTATSWMRLLTENSGVHIWPHGYANAVASPRFKSCHENIKLRSSASGFWEEWRYITAQLFSSKELWLISDKHLHRKIKAWPCSRLRNGTVNVSYASKNCFFLWITVYSRSTSASDTIYWAQIVTTMSWFSHFKKGRLENYQNDYSISIILSTRNNIASS